MENLLLGKQRNRSLTNTRCKLQAVPAVDIVNGTSTASLLAHRRELAIGVFIGNRVTARSNGSSAIPVTCPSNPVLHFHIDRSGPACVVVDSVHVVGIINDNRKHNAIPYEVNDSNAVIRLWDWRRLEPLRTIPGQP